MKAYSLFRTDSGSGNFPPPPPPPPSFNPTPPPQQPSGYMSSGPGAGSNAIIALVLGILSFIACGIIAAIPAWIMGKREINEINAGRSSQAGMTFAKIGMWLGIINVIISILGIIFIVIALAAGLFNLDDYR